MYLLLFQTSVWYIWHFGKDHRLSFTGHMNVATPYNKFLHSKASVSEHLKLLKSLQKCYSYSLINFFMNVFKANIYIYNE